MARRGLQCKYNQFLVIEKIPTKISINLYFTTTANIVFHDFIYTNDTDEPILAAFDYDGVPYTDICPETTKEYEISRLCTTGRYGFTMSVITFSLPSSQAPSPR